MKTDPCSFECNYMQLRKEAYAFPKGTIYQDVFIYIKVCISVSRLDFIYQDLNIYIKICVYVSRITFGNCDHNCEDHSSFDFISAVHI